MDQERPLPQPCKRALHAAAGVEQGVALIGNLDARRDAAFEVGLDQIGLVVHVDDGAGDAGVGEAVKHVVDEGLAAGFLGVHSLPDLSGVLGIPQDYQPIGVVTVGHAAADRRSSSLARGAKRDEVVLHRDKWRGRRT